MTITTNNQQQSVSKKTVNTEHDLSAIEQVVMQGDLSKLNSEQRVTYYHRVCESMGLNPYTRPFDYISLNGKLTLYAKKDATEQLRQVKKISIISLEGRLVDDLYIVVAKASTPDGRIDQSTGAVNIGALKGEAKANAIMKAETKAKRRVTLSISGMGWTDESEVDSIPDAKRVDVSIETGEIIEQPKEEPKKIAQKLESISLVEAEELRLLCNTSNPESRKKIKKLLFDQSLNSLKDLPLASFKYVKDLLLRNQISEVSALQTPLEEEMVDE